MHTALQSRLEDIPLIGIYRRRRFGLLLQDVFSLIPLSFFFLHFLFFLFSVSLVWGDVDYILKIHAHDATKRFRDWVFHFQNEMNKQRGAFVVTWQT